MPTKTKSQKLRGQDRRLVEEAERLLQRLAAHDSRLPNAPGSRRSNIPIVDPTDPDMLNAVVVLADRFEYLLNLT